MYYRQSPITLIALIIPKNLYHPKFYNKSYFEAGRSGAKRSIPEVCEHLRRKPDAKRALLENFAYQFFLPLIITPLAFSSSLSCVLSSCA